MTKKILSILIAVAMCVCPITAFGVSISSVDLDTQEITYRTQPQETIVASFYNRPTALIVSHVSGMASGATPSSLSEVRYSEDSGVSWELAELPEEAVSMTMWDILFFRRSYLIVGEIDGKAAMIRSDEGKEWQFFDVSAFVGDIDGTIRHAFNAGDEIYLYIEHNDTVSVLTSIDSWEYKLQEVEGITQSLEVVPLKNMYVGIIDKTLYTSDDCLKWTAQSIEANIPNNFVLSGYALNDISCADPIITVTYADKIEYWNIYITDDDGGLVYTDEMVQGGNEYVILGPAARIWGDWGYPVIVVNEWSVSTLLLDDEKDIRTPCQRTDSSWVTQKDFPSSETVYYVEQAGVYGVLGTRALPENWSDGMSRQMFASSIYNFFKSIAPDILESASNKNPYTDIDDDKVSTLSNLGVFNGVGGGLFDPDRDISRQEVAVGLHNMIEVIKKYIAIDEQNILNRWPITTREVKFLDYDDVADWAISQASHCVDLGLLVTDDMKLLHPTESIRSDDAYFAIMKLRELTLN